MYSASPSPSSAAQSRICGWSELALLVSVMWFLYWLSAPLGDAPLGLGQRYIQTDSAATDSLRRHAAWLNTHAGLVIVWLGALGYFSLLVARCALPWGAAICLWMAIWFSGGRAFFPVSENVTDDFTQWSVIEYLLNWPIAVVLLVLVPIAARIYPNHWLASKKPVHVAAYPGFFLFTGLGALWLIDFSARGQIEWKFLGSEHVSALYIAYAAFSFSALFGAQFFQWLARIWGYLDRAVSSGRTVAALVRQAIPWLLAAACIALIAQNTDVRQPAKGAELIRLVACLMGAWMIFRWASTSPNVRRAVVGYLVMVALVVAGLLGIHDFGQVMVLSWAAAVVSGSVVAMEFSRWFFNSPRLTASMGAVVTCGVVAVGQWALRLLVPYLPAHIEDRITAITEPFTGKFEYLSEIRWFLHSTPPLGNGLGHVPWCGTLAEFSHLLNTYVACRGVPKETYSDYVFAALAGTWGWPVALVISAALAAWLVSLLRPRTMNLGSISSAGLVQAFGLCFVTVTLMQLLVTCLGSVGLISLTGVNFPFLGFGGTSLTLCAVCVGMLINQEQAK